MVVPCLFLAGVVPSLTLFRCRHDEQVRLAPCCADEDEVAAQDEIFSDDDACCDVTTLHSPHLSFLRADSGTPLPPPSVAIVAAPAMRAVRSTVRVRVDDWRVPFSTGVPIHIRHAALLN
jgi:hypothetical protein